MKTRYYEKADITAVRDEKGSICLYQGKFQVNGSLPSVKSLLMVMSSKKKKPSFPETENEMIEIVRHA